MKSLARKKQLAILKEVQFLPPAADMSVNIVHVTISFVWPKKLHLFLHSYCGHFFFPVQQLFSMFFLRQFTRHSYKLSLHNIDRFSPAPFLITSRPIELGFLRLSSSFANIFAQFITKTLLMSGPVLYASSRQYNENCTDCTMRATP